MSFSRLAIRTDENKGRAVLLATQLHHRTEPWHADSCEIEENANGAGGRRWTQLEFCATKIESIVVPAMPKPE